MAQTTLEYLEKMFQYEEDATLIEECADGQGRRSLVLDRTIFYPQGGGQASDSGTITAPGFCFVVSAVVYDQGRVLHAGVAQEGEPPIGERVRLSVDVDRRVFNSRLQSAGHVLLNAMSNVGQDLVATKGYHFPDGPYVEFRGAVPEDRREQLTHDLQAEVDRLVALDLPVTTELVSPERLRAMCRHVPPNVPTDKPSRVVTIDDFSQPCGGTHVRSLKDLAGMRVERIRVKKGDTRVSYCIPEPKAASVGR